MEEKLQLLSASVPLILARLYETLRRDPRIEEGPRDDIER